MTASPARGGHPSDAPAPAIEARPAHALARHALRSPYDIALRVSYVGAPGNASIGINGFVPPSRATVPAKAESPTGSYQEIGGVPYVYAIGRTEITAGEYVTFLNKVDPTGSNPVQPVTGIRLWSSAFSPVTNPFSGQINLVQNASPGTHYRLAADFWRNKPLVNGNLIQFAYFDNSLYNGSTVAIDNSRGRSPLGYRVHQQTRYVSLSTNISTGMYDLSNSSYPYFSRMSTSGYVIPSENEWVKAAYYSPRHTGNGTHYYYYPTVSNKPPTALTTADPRPTVDRLGHVIRPNLTRGVAYSNYNKGVVWQPPYDPETADNGANVVDVGGDRTPSPWLTYDQGGNVVEYTDTAVAPPAGVPNPRNLPAYVKVHGGIANAATYQLWLTATGTSSPYGQELGQVGTQGGARFGYVPNAKADRSIGTSRGVSQSSLASPLASEGLVYRLDNLNTLSTFYTTNLTQAITLANDPSTYVSLGASFEQPATPGGVPVYGFLNTATRTQFYTTDPQAAAAAASNPGYASEGVVFHALPAGVGATNYREFYNPQTGAYAYSAAADVQFFTSRGYSIQGDAWSVG
ncbi:hypothetical protein OJF2_73820 [Aquisphaera giovannonii]|uniref:DUF5648 domain-containing protein n=2 Tax=Aquisphaera giovannonii TaxID=406548 RepID=A0A5B9WDR9_9BACT|nr:hypothetical protein OJF2_73820 [Aquisphaera giovannonii]